MIPSDIFATFRDIGFRAATLITPFSLHLLYLLLLIEVLTIGITWMMGSNDDHPEILWRIVRLLFTGGFAFWWLENAWHLGIVVIGSFDMIGQRLSSQPDLTPMAFINTAIAIGKTLTSAPSSTRIMPDLGVMFAELAVSLIIWLAIMWIALVAVFALAQIFLLIGPGSILLALVPCRFTSQFADGYPTWLMRSGMLLLGCYVVLGACQGFATHWHTDIANACGATTSVMPTPLLGSGPPLVTVVTCTKPIPMAMLWTLCADALVLAIMGSAVPFTLASIVSHGVNLTMEHVASARYLASGIARGVSRGTTGLTRAVYRSVQANRTQSRLEQRIAAGRAAAASMAPSRQPTMQLPKQPARNAFGVPSTTGLNGSIGRQTSKL